MKVLVACEFSGRVRESFKAKGHDAWSCDLLPTEIEGQHLQCDVLTILDQGWDLMIAHPPCTYLSVSGLHWNKKRPERAKLTEEAVDFVSKVLGAAIPRICVENPIGILSTRIRRPDQIIQPYQFGEDASKATCFWLKELSKLRPTKYVEPRVVNDKKRWANQTDSGQNRLGPSPERAKERGKTYGGIARAMAEQWG